MSNSEGKGEDIVLKLYLHCQKCSKSVVKCLKQFPGVDEVISDVENHKVIVKGSGVDPKSIAERVQNMCHKHVEIISPKPPQQAKVIDVVLDVYIHCQNCGNSFKERLLKMKGVRKVEVDKVKSQVKVEGIFEANELVEYVDQKMGKKASIVTTSTPEDVNTPKPSSKKKQVKKQTAIEDDDAPKIIYTTSNCSSDFFPPHEYDSFFHASNLLSDECSQQCSVM